MRNLEFIEKVEKFTCKTCKGTGKNCNSCNGTGLWKEKSYLLLAFSPEGKIAFNVDTIK